MKQGKKTVMITEFQVQVYGDGKIVWNGFDAFLLWKLNQKPKEGFIPYVRRILRFI